MSPTVRRRPSPRATRHAAFAFAGTGYWLLATGYAFRGSRLLPSKVLLQPQVPPVVASGSETPVLGAEQHEVEAQRQAIVGTEAVDDVVGAVQGPPYGRLVHSGEWRHVVVVRIIHREAPAQGVDAVPLVQQLGPAAMGVD